MVDRQSLVAVLLERHGHTLAAELGERQQFTRLIAALVRTQLAKDFEAVRQAAPSYLK